jgi:hypothetical protein
VSWDDIPEGYMSVPQPWEGSSEQLQANLNTHFWRGDDPEEAVVCDDCGTKFGHTTSRYPCGTNVPRMLVKAGSNQAQKAIMRSMGLPMSLLKGDNE